MKHGFIRKANGSITIIDAPHAGKVNDQGTLLYAINNSGVIAGAYLDKNFLAHAFSLSTSGAFTVLKLPVSIFAIPASVNSNGAIVGSYILNNGLFNSQGFLYLP